jgi:uroporphyrinogen decarboxylase
MNKRDALLSLLDDGKTPGYVPAAFFLHFDPIYHHGQAAVDKHLEYFRYTGMDLVKIQFEHHFPHLADIRHPADWVRMPFYDLDFYREPLKVVEGLVKAAKKDAVVVLTLYSPFMLAGQSTSEETVVRHIHENPEAFKRGIEVITASLMGFVKECIRLGLDGFYTSTQGGEAGRMESLDLFNTCVRPYDLAIMEEVNRGCIFNILHVCDYRLPYADLAPFADYPGQVVSCGLDLAEGKEINPGEVSALFKRPFMGGINRLGILASGSVEDARKEARKVLAMLPKRSILGADCTVPGSTNWDNLRAAIDEAHHWPVGG